MQIALPIFKQIQSDLKLPPRALQVWIAAIDHLDLVESRRLKLAQIEVLREIDESTVSRALNVLVDRGYLCREGNLYRVPLSRRECETEVIEPPTDVESQPARRQTRKVRRVHSPGVL